MKTTRTTLYILLLALFSPIFLFSQVSDPFSDGDFTQNPTWVGDQSHFIINSQNQLQLNAASAGTSILKLLHGFESDSLEWRLSIQLQFAPSSSNNTMFILKSADTSFSDNSNYFYLQFGENLSNDAIELFYKSAQSVSSICRGTNGKIANPFDFNLKVTYHEPGLWNIYLDESKTGDYILDGSGFLPDTIPMNSMGFYLTYTSSNIKKFIFDNIYFGAPLHDTIKPCIEKVSSNDDRNKLIIKYSEYVNGTNALSKFNYIIDNFRYPDSVFFQSDDLKSVILLFNKEFPNPYICSISISNVSDFSGNIMVPFSSQVTFRTVKRNDIIISEIMADPTPQILLPPCEFIELYNRNFPDTIYMSGWKLKLGNSIKSLPDMKIPFQNYVIIVANSCMSEYIQSYFPVYAVSSLGITNDGQELILMNSRDEVIDYVYFNVNWHQNPLKRDGGWSLEIKDKETPCLNDENWDSSTSNEGGTPTKCNSIDQEVVDLKPPEIEKGVIQDFITITLFFDEPISELKGLNSFHIDHGVRVFKADLISPSNKMVKIELYDPLLKNTIYTLTIQDTIKDCSENMVPIGSSTRIAIPEDPLPGDIVLNEILTDSYQSTDADFIEIYNRSGKVIDVGKMRVGSGNSIFPEKLVFISSSGFLLFPNQYLAICKNRRLTESQYFCTSPKQLISNDSLPNFSNQNGTVYLTDYNLNNMDSYTYSIEDHSSFLSSYDGVSLEKIDFNIESKIQSNWHSAVAAVGYATPGYQNSNYRDLQFIDQSLSLNPTIISPNNDGLDDFVEIICQFSELETRVTLQVFDSNGHLIKVIANNEITSGQTFYKWYGSKENGSLVVGGIYIIKLEYWNLKGESQSIKKVVSVIN